MEFPKSLTFSNITYLGPTSNARIPRVSNTLPSLKVDLPEIDTPERRPVRGRAYQTIDPAAGSGGKNQNINSVEFCWVVL